MEQFEYIVVGGGSAGMALAARLSQAKRKTLLIEAGRKKGNLFNFWHVDMPAAYGYAFLNPAINWKYEGEPEPHLKGRRMYQPRGKVLGGSSAINGMGYMRPHPGVFDRWVDQGAAGWSFDDVLPFFRKMETWHGTPSPLRGTDGPVHVIKGQMDCVYYDAFLKAGEQAGFAISDDLNGETPEGFGHFQMNIEDGVRASTGHAYGKHVVNRDWLTITDHAHVTRVVIENGAATGVEYIRYGKTHTARAEGEIILSGGAFNTPQILMLSGVGPEDELARHGIAIETALPGVGQNLQDHPILYPKYLSKAKDSPIRYQRLDRKALTGLRWLLSHSGPGATNYMEGAALLRAGVDSDLRMFGIDKLRIADASVMPVITNANTNATSIMIGERAAALLLDNLIDGEMT